MTDKTLPTLVAAASIASGDIILGRIGAETEDRKVPMTVVLTFVSSVK